MSKGIEISQKNGPEKVLYEPKQTRICMVKKSKPDVSPEKNIEKNAGDSISKKKRLSPNDSTISRDEEATLVNHAVKTMTADVKTGKVKTALLDDVLSEEDRRRGL